MDDVDADQLLNEIKQLVADITDQQGEPKFQVTSPTNVEIVDTKQKESILSNVNPASSTVIKEQSAEKLRETVRLIRKENNDLKRWKMLHEGKLRELEELEVVHKEKEDKIGILQRKIKEQKSVELDLKKHARKRSQALHQLETEVERLQLGDHQFDRLMDNFTNRKRESHINTRVTKMLTTKQNLKQDMASLKKAKTRSVNTLEKSLKKEKEHTTVVVKRLKKEIENAEYKVKLAENRTKETHAELERMQSVIRKLRKEKEKVVQELKNKTTEANELSRTVSKLEKNIEKNSKNLTKQQKALNAKNKKKMNAQKKQADNQIRSQEALLVKLQKELQTNERMYSKQDAKIQRLERLLHELKKDAGQGIMHKDMSATGPYDGAGSMSDDLSLSDGTASRRSSIDSSTTFETNSSAQSSNLSRNGGYVRTNSTTPTRSPRGRRRYRHRKVKKAKTIPKADRKTIPFAQELLDDLRESQEKITARLNKQRAMCQQINWEIQFGKRQHAEQAEHGVVE